MSHISSKFGRSILAQTIPQYGATAKGGAATVKKGTDRKIIFGQCAKGCFSTPFGAHAGSKQIIKK